jgi:hypothetical protein
VRYRFQVKDIPSVIDRAAEIAVEYLEMEVKTISEHGNDQPSELSRSKNVMTVKDRHKEVG